MSPLKWLAVAAIALLLGTACSTPGPVPLQNREHVAEDADEVMAVK